MHERILISYYPGLDYIFIRLGPAPHAFTVWFSCLHMHGNSSLLETNVTILSHLSHWAPWVCEGTPSINSGILKVISTRIFVMLTGYCHIGSQRGRVSTHVRARKMGIEEGVGGAGSGWMKMWSSLGLSYSPIHLSLIFDFWREMKFSKKIKQLISHCKTLLGN